MVQQNWHGEEISNSRAVIRLECDADVPCYDLTVDNVNLWTEDGDYVKWSCQNAYGSGACLASAKSTTKLATYTSVSTITATPYVSYCSSTSTVTNCITHMWDRKYSATTMAGDFKTAPASNSSFTIPPMPTTFYPGATPISKLLSLTAAGGL